MVQLLCGVPRAVQLLCHPIRVLLLRATVDFIRECADEGVGCRRISPTTVVLSRRPPRGTAVLSCTTGLMSCVLLCATQLLLHPIHILLSAPSKRPGATTLLWSSFTTTRHSMSASVSFVRFLFFSVFSLSSYALSSSPLHPCAPPYSLFPSSWTCVSAPVSARTCQRATHALLPSPCFLRSLISPCR